MEIDNEILQRTTKCGKNFACLNNDKHILCPLEDSLSNEYFIIRCLNDDECPYQMSFLYFDYMSQESDLCTCPTRIEIYKKYII